MQWTMWTSPGPGERGRGGAATGMVMFLLVVLAASHADAQDTTAGTPARDAAASPPAKARAPRIDPAAVSMADRARARALFLEGNELLEIPLFAEAAARYEQALALWPHPGFYYNLVIAQLNLVQPVEAYRSLQKALEHGPEIIGWRRYRQGLVYRARLERKLGFVTVSCAEPGAEVRLDGKLLFIAPGHDDVVVLPGSHQVVASKPGYVPGTVQLVISAGQRRDVALRPRLPDHIATRRYLPAWAPWLGMAGGVALVAAGGVFDWRSSTQLGEYEQAFAASCPLGCRDVETPDLDRRRRASERGHHIATGLYVAGGVVLAGSAVFLYINRERVVRTEARPGAEGIAVTPAITANAAGLAVTGRF